MGHFVNMEGVTKRYAGFSLEGVNLVIDPGEVVGLIGRNGAGKTTLIKSLLGIVRTDGGTVTLLGETGACSPATREHLGVILDTCPFVDEMRVSDVAFLGKVSYPGWDGARFEELCHASGLDGRKQVEKLSRGMGMSLQMAFALAHDPQLLVLDEPTAGLDPIAREEALDALRDFMDDDRAILISSHITTDLEHIADRIVCIDEGRIVFDIPKDDICDTAGIARCRTEEVDAVVGSGLASSPVHMLRGAFSTDVFVPDRHTFARTFPEVTLDRVTIEKYMTLVLKGETR